MPDKPTVENSEAGSPLKTQTDVLATNVISSSIVNVKDYGATGNGYDNDWQAIQNATATGKIVFFPDGDYFLLGTVFAMGRVRWKSSGKVKLLSDTLVLDVKDGSDSEIDNFELENVTKPWIITRKPDNWLAVPTPYRSNEDGYQPTENDGDVWSGLTAEQQHQQIGPSISFHGDASGIRISRISGRFVNIFLHGAVRSEVFDCNIRAGKSFLGGIGFWNVSSQPGLQNKAYNNVVRFSSGNGIGFGNNFEGVVNNNIVLNPGESGIKFFQGDVGDPAASARCYFMNVYDNFVKYAFYDCFDLQADYGSPYTYRDTRHKVCNNKGVAARRTGIYMDGRNNQITGNVMDSCGDTGILVSMHDAEISDNFVFNCNTANALVGTHQIVVQGHGNLISGNYINQSGGGVERPGYAIYAPDKNRVSDNYAVSGEMFFGIAGAVIAQLSNNMDEKTTSFNSTMPNRIRQNLTNISALTLYNDTTAFDNVDQDFHPRHNFLTNPIARLTGQLTKGANGAENGYLIGSAAQGGVMHPGFVIQTDDTIPGKAWFSIYAQTIAIPGSYLPMGSFTTYIDEAGNNLKFVVRYSSGIEKSGTVPLV